MRLFLAVNFSGPLRQELTTRIDLLPKQVTGVDGLRWTRPETWHLTLQFLGDWPESRLPALKSALEALPLAGDFVLRPGDVGGFPDLRRPRVLFMHMDSDGKLEELAGQVRRVTGDVWPDGPQDSRRFKAHLTLARVKGPWDAAWSQAVAEHHWADLPHVSVCQFQLMSSVLLPEGARHEVLHSFPV